MEITILDNILHGSLKPWQKDFDDNRRLTELLLIINDSSLEFADNPCQLLRILLKDYEELEKLLFNQPLSDESMLEFLFSIETPSMVHPVEQFYQAIIKLECLRLINAFDIKLNALNHLFDRAYNYKKFIKNIRVLAQQTTEELNNRLSPFVQTDNKEQVSNILTFLQKYLIMLYFDIQERYSTWNYDKHINLAFFFTHYLKQPIPANSPLKKEKPYFVYNLFQLGQPQHYDRKYPLYFIEQLNIHKPDDSNLLHAAAENIIYLYEHGDTDTYTNVKELTNKQLIIKTVNAAKSVFTKQINVLQFGYQRLEQANKALDELDYVNPPFPLKESIPQYLASFYTEQKNIFTQNYNVKFPVFTDEPADAQAPVKSPKIDFEFTGDLNNLKKVITDLNGNINLLDTSRTSVEELFAALTNPIYPNSKKIYLACETVQFRYVIDKLSPYFKNLSLVLIDKSKAFISKNDTIINKGNLSASKNSFPKNDRTINNIFKQMQ